MRRQMREMDRMMNTMIMDPFGAMGGGMFGGYGHPGSMDPRHQMIEDGSSPAGRHAQAQQLQMQQHRPHMMSPFGGFGGLLGGGLFSGLMNHMEDMQEVVMADPNSHVYSHSTTITFDGNRQPRIYEESLRKAGDVKETRRTMRNGENGDRMEIGHHMGDRSHVIEKKRDKDGRVREQQKFVNLDEGTAEDFDREFQTRVRDNYGHGRSSQAAISGSSVHQHHHPSSRQHNGNGTTHPGHSSSTPIITLPDDEEEPQHRRHSNSARSRASSNGAGGPVIQEISDDEAERATPKRRRGVFGRMFQANDE